MLHRNSTASCSVEKYSSKSLCDAELEEAMKEYAKMKCKELLEIVAEKAKIKDEDGDVYEQPKGFYCNGELYETWVDKDSILNAVNLDEFIK